MPVGRPLLALMAFLVGALGFIASSHGHALQPGYLELRLIDGDLHAAVWKVPASGGRPMAIAARLPANCDPRTPGPAIWDGNAYVSRWTARCPGGLDGGEIYVEGLARTSTDVLVRFETAEGTSEARRLTPGAPSFTVPTRASRLDVVRTYFLLGVEHILRGIDHLLFVACLVLIAGTFRRMLITVTGFTIAHSITLALAALQLVRVPVPPVEATIALSVVFLAAELVRDRRRTLTWRFPIAVSASFGLLHGFGFAAALGEIGLPRTEVPTALLFFNLGVEAGQIAFVIALVGMFLLGTSLLRGSGLAAISAAARRHPLQRPAGYAVGALASFWLIDRLAGFWT